MLIRRDGPTPGANGPNAPAGAVHVLAPAKVNLYLEARGRRPDGYHEIETLILAVDLCDEITLAPDPSGKLCLTCDRAELSAGEDNLVLKAARLLKERTGCGRGAAIRLVKRIPWAAGLGGGSSDAAATLAGLNELWGLGLPTARLSELGAELGSDVPFFFHAPAAVCTGRGEGVRPVTTGRSFDIVIVKPEAGLNTAEVYREFAARGAEGAAPGPGPAVEALAEGDAEALGKALFNRLQGPAFRLCPPAAELYGRLRASGAAGCLLSGSGSSLFALCRDDREAARVIDDLRRGWPPGSEWSGTRAILVRSCLSSTPQI
jgi:4-diphosphocytidyl-2-C-methyl-D-erythritol kinase